MLLFKSSLTGSRDILYWPHDRSHSLSVYQGNQPIISGVRLGSQKVLSRSFWDWQCETIYDLYVLPVTQPTASKHWMGTSYYAPAPGVGALSNEARLTSACLMSVWHLSVTYIGPKSRTERPRNTEIGTEVAYVIHDSRYHFQGQKVKGQLAGGGGILWRSPTQLVSVAKEVMVLPLCVCCQAG